MDDPVQQPAGWWLDAVIREERRGELLRAYDLADRGLEEHPGDLALQHRAVLALARTGATERAARFFSEFGLDRVLDEDVAALGARIAKDKALASEGPERRGAAARAAKMYDAIYARTGGYYPAINAATLSLVAGDLTRSRALAAEVLGILAASGEGSYYAAATDAEARLLLGEEPAARVALERAALVNGGDVGALATTRRQLRLICELSGIGIGVLAPLAGPAVVHFCGHRIATAGEAGRFPSSMESSVAAAIAEVVAQQQIGFAYGALASGADILWAEAAAGTRQRAARRSPVRQG